jgi:hypothetical protein
MSEKIVEVKNRDCGYVGYTIKDKGIWRNFAPGETKKISLEELEALQWTPGGEYTLKNLLMVNDKDALSVLNIETEPEYFYTEAEVRELLTTGTLDQLKDCLDFAPEGVIEIIKKMAVEMELSDTRKRAAITEKTGFSIDNAINVNAILNTEENTEVVENTKGQRRAAPLVEEPTKQRRVTPKYNVVTPKN